MGLIVFLFFVSIFFIFHAYFGYPLSLLLIRIFGKNQRKRHPVHLPATLIITVYNEEKRIKEKLDNTLKLNYPEGNLQILVASDGSDDGTNDIVKAYEKYGVELLEVVNRGGKENAQKEAIPHARGEILIFSDVATKIEPQGLMEIVSNFADPSVGCVSSEDRLIDRDGKPSGEGLYVRYEMWLRLLESQVNTLVGLSGSFFAARKQVCQDFSGEVQSDFRTLLSSVKIGLKGVSDPKAIGYYLDIADEKKEFDRKIRTVLRGLTVFFNHLEFLNIKKYGLFSYQLFCHKLLRWLVPFFLFSAFVSNALLIFSPLFFILFLCQFVFYGLAVYGWKIHLLKGIFKIPMFFMIVNAAIAVAWWQFFSGKRIVLWTPSRR